MHGLHILVVGLASTQKRPRKVVGAGAAKTRLDIARKHQPIVHTRIIAEQLIQGIGACMPPLRRVMADFAWRTNPVRKFPSAKGADTTHCTAVPKDVAAYKFLLRFRGHATFRTIKHRLYSNAVEMTQGRYSAPVRLCRIMRVMSPGRRGEAAAERGNPSRGGFEMPCKRLLDVKQFHVEDEGCLWGDDSAGPGFPVSQFGWNDKGRLAADADELHSLGPSGNHSVE